MPIYQFVDLSTINHYYNPKTSEYIEDLDKAMLLNVNICEWCFYIINK